MKDKSYSFICKFTFLLLVFLITSISFYAQNKPGTDAKISPKDSTYNHTGLSYKIINASDNTFGYDIYSGGNLLIHQAIVPVLPGNKGFTTKTKAEIVAKHVIGKIKAGEIPPTVTLEELKKLKVL